MDRAGRADAEIVGAIYDAVADPARWVDVLALMAARLDADSGTIFYLDHRNALGQIEATFGRFAGEPVERYKREFAAIDPAPAAFTLVPVGINTTTNRLFGPEKIRKDPFFNEFFRTLGLDETMGGAILRDGQRIGIIGIHRGGRRRWFSDGQLRIADAFVPHLARALQLHRQFAQVSGVAGALARFVDELAVGVNVLAGSGHAVHVNRRAASVIARADGLRLDRDGRPSCTAADASAALARLVGAAVDRAQLGSGGVVRVPRRGGRPPYTVLVAPQAASFGFAADAKGGGTGGALLLVHDPDAVTLPLPAMLRTLSGSPARGGARRRAGRGLRLADIAEQSGTSLNTVIFTSSRSTSRPTPTPRPG